MYTNRYEQRQETPTTATIVLLDALNTPIQDQVYAKRQFIQFLKTLQPMGQISAVSDIVNAVLYLTDAGQVTGEVLRVDGGSHVGKW